MGLWELFLLAAWVAAPWAPAPWAALLLVGATVAWLATRPPRREIWLAGVGILVALAALSAGIVRGPRVPSGEVLQARLETGYAQLWSDLGRQAEVASRQVSLPLASDLAKLELSGDLSELVEESGDGDGRTTLLVVDPDGRAVVWAGEGLLHELEAPDLPRRGPAYEASFGAVTFLVAEPLTPAERPWRLVAARSLSLDRLPFVDVWGPALSHRWSVTDDPDGAVPGAWKIGVGTEAPLLVVEPTSEGPARSLRTRWHEPEHRVAWGGLAFALLSLLVLRATGLALPGVGEAVHPPRSLVGPALAGTAAAGFAALVPPVALGALGLGVSAVLWAVHRLHQTLAPLPRWARALGGVGVALAAAAAAWSWQEVFRPVDLAAVFFDTPLVLALRLALFGLTLTLLILTGGHGTARRPREQWAWLAVALLLAGLALHDVWLLGGSLLLLGSAAAALWLQDRRALAHPGPVAVLVLLAVLISAGAWETVYRQTLRQTLAEETLPRMAPPEEAELAALAARVRTTFDRLDLAEIVPRDPQGMERRDLAYTLWTRSPLSLANTFSSLVIEPEEGPASTFSFGLRLNDDLVPERPPQRIPEPTLPGWDEARIAGRGRLLYRGRPWARVFWWLAPRPGFRLEEERPQEATGEALLAGGPRIETEVEGLPGSSIYALYDTSTGRALLSPWTESSPLPPELDPVAEINEKGVRATTPAGPAWAYARRRPGAVEVVYLPVLTPSRALERAGTHAASVLLALGLLVTVGLLLALPRPGFRSLLQRTFRSYSKRLILVYTALLLLPLLSVNVLLVAGAEERLGREQRAAGLSALDSAERLLVESMLSQQPGFDLKTALDNDELTWLSQVVHHDVNLYWENDVWASSKSELFAAGLLPKRIPGEVHARLDLLGFDQASRTNRVGDTRYLELYSPVRIPGEPGGRAPLSLSLPLLAQQEEVARELATLRRQVFLVTAVLFVLLVAVGLRLARSFTEPIDELVEGTRRIAAGAPSLDLAPTELELAALVEAIDDMADKIARGRRRLLREKQVVERIVENITSGVLSLDRERRVLLRNRVAEDLLGVDVGTSLEAAADRLPGPVAEFLDQAADEPLQKTVRLTSGEEDREWNLVWVPVPGDGEPAALLVVEDATDILRGQRLEAWAEMARIIAHEIKNPLTPIRLNAEHAAMVYESDPDHFSRVFERCMGNILSQVAELQQIASEFSTYSSILRIERKRGDLVEAMEELVEPYRTAPPEGLEIRFEANQDSLEVLFDRRLLTRAVRNLLENALRASSAGGEVTVSVDARDGHATITVADSGPGVDPALLSRIFDPYFSTHDAGTGLGLPIARRVAEEHGGSIAARNVPGAGLSVAITIPL